MKPLIVANWKMNPSTIAEAKKLFNSVKKGSKKVKNVEVIICPPFPYISELKYQKSKLKLGGQNCFWQKTGPFTGEVSPSMLKDLGCQYVILGHSERRTNFFETDEIINKKIKAALLAKLNIIFCIGETREEREKEETKDILKSQIKKGLQEISKKEIGKITIAYEPVWAIGTGNPCDPEEVQKMALLIRKIISEMYSPLLAKNLGVIYGGSVNSQNLSSFLRESKVNGFVLGGAFLDPKEFIKIIRIISSH